MMMLIVVYPVRDLRERVDVGRDYDVVCGGETLRNKCDQGVMLLLEFSLYQWLVQQNYWWCYFLLRHHHCLLCNKEEENLIENQLEIRTMSKWQMYIPRLEILHCHISFC